MSERESLRPKTELDLANEMDPNLAALAWENFLKRIDNGEPEGKARTLLSEELELFSKEAGKNPNISALLLDNNAQESASELKKYLVGKLLPRESRFVKKDLPHLDKEMNPIPQPKKRKAEEKAE
ncbi:MAG: hypothetical protein AAB568_03390 [Patescibacteria group bacterium]